MGGRSETTQGQAKMASWNSFNYICTRALHPFAHCRAASTVIPLLPKATFTPTIQLNLGLPRTRPSLTSAINTLLAIQLVMQSKKNSFFKIKNSLKKKNIVKKKHFFIVFYYYLQFKGSKVFFNTLECLFILYTSCKTLHSACQLHFHWFRDKLLNELQYKSP